MICSLCQFDNPASSARCRACGAALSARSSESDATPDALPTGALLIGTYAVEGVLGQGGFGITYRCHDRMLDRRVAVKEFFPSGCRRENAEVKASRAQSESDYREARAQFLAEARTLARCHHPGIVSVHAAFEANQTAYMVMELLHGQTLAQLLSARGGRLEQSEAVGIIERVGAALGFVHQQDLLHRDIKPDNIMVCDDGRVMLIDFGTARETLQGQEQNHTVVVTPGYAPLEQYAKQARRGPFTDIYSLAATLYHLLTGQMPPAASDRAMGVVLRSVREVNPNIGASVASAVERGLALEIARRPQSVREFLDALNAPEADDESAASMQNADLSGAASGPISADALPLPEAMFSDTLRARQQLLEGLLPDEQRQASDAQIVSRPVKIAPQTPMVSAQLAPSATVSSGALPNSSGRAGGNVAVKKKGQPSDVSVVSVVVLFAVVAVGFGLASLFSPRPRMRNVGPSGYSGAVVQRPSNWSPARSSQSSLTRNNEAKKVALKTWNALQILLPTSSEVLPQSKAEQTPDSKRSYTARQEAVAFSPDGERLAYVDDQAILRVLSVPERRVVRTLTLDKNRTAAGVLFSADNGIVAVSQTDKIDGPNRSEPINRVDVWNLRTGQRLGTYAPNNLKDYVVPQAVLNNGKLVLRIFEKSDWKQYLWEAKSGGKRSIPLTDVRNGAYGVLSPDGKTFVIGDSQGELRWLNPETGQQIKQYSTRPAGATVSSSQPFRVLGLNYSSDGKWLASRNEAEISLFNSESRKVGSFSIEGKSSGLGAQVFAVSPDGRWLAAHGSLPDSPEGNLLWNVKTGEKIRLQGPYGNLLNFSFSRDSQQLYGILAAGNTTQLVTWQTGGTPVAPFVNSGEVSFELTDSPLYTISPLAQAGSRIAVGTPNFIEIGQTDGTRMKRLKGIIPGVMSMEFSSDGQLLAARYYDGSIGLWNVGAGETVAQVKVSPSQATKQKEEDRYISQLNPHNMAFSLDNKYFACALTDGDSSMVELWSLQGTPRRLGSLSQTENVNALTFSPDGKSLFCGGEKGLLQWYDVATRQLKTRISNQNPVADIVFTSQKLVVVGYSKTTLYQLPKTSGPRFQREKQLEIPVFLSERRIPLTRWAVSADGKLLANTPFSRVTEIWQLSDGSLLQTLQAEFPEGADNQSLAFSDEGKQLTSLRRPTNGNQVSVETYRRAKTK